MSVMLGVDIGATKILAGAVDDAGRVLSTHAVPTPSSGAAAVEDAIVAALAPIRAQYPQSETLGVGAAGWTDPTRRRMLFSAFVSWVDEPLAERLEARLGQRVVLENDASAAGWAEARFGAAQGYSSVVVLTLGSSIGGAVINDGQLLRGSRGAAGELGHTVVDPGGPLCACGRHGCLERYSSGRAIIRHAISALEDGRASTLRGPDGEVPSALDGRTVTAAARAGDEVALRALAETGRWLGRGLADSLLILDPEVYVISGGVVSAADLIIPHIEAALAAEIGPNRAALMPLIVPGRLGPEAGLIGAADLGRL